MRGESYLNPMAAEDQITRMSCGFTCMSCGLTRMGGVGSRGESYLNLMAAEDQITRMSCGFTRMSFGFTRMSCGFTRMSCGFTRMSCGFTRMSCGFTRMGGVGSRGESFLNPMAAEDQFLLLPSVASFRHRPPMLGLSASTSIDPRVVCFY